MSCFVLSNPGIFFGIYVDTYPPPQELLANVYVSRITTVSVREPTARAPSSKFRFLICQPISEDRTDGLPLELGWK